MTGGSVARRVVVGTLSNSIGQAVVVLSSLALTPFFVGQVGATAYGLWVLVGSLTSFVYLLDLGLSAALVKFVAEHAAGNDAEEASRMVGAATWLYVLLGLTAAALGTAFAFVLPSLFGLEPAVADDARAVMILTAFGAGISIPAVAPLAVLRGLQRFTAVNALTSGTTLLGTALIVAALVLDAGIVGVAWAGLASSALTLGLSVTVARRAAPEYTHVLVSRDRARLRRLLSFSAPVAVMQIAGRMQTRVDAIVIGAALPVSSVAPYSFAQQLGAGTRLLAEQFTRVLLPMATQMGAVRGRDSVRNLLLTSTRLTLALALAAALPLGLFGGEILTLWVGSEFGGYGVLVALLAASAVIDVMTYPATAVLQSADLHRPLATMALGSGVANIVLSILLVGPLGLDGVALATLLATAGEIGFFIVPYMSRSLDVAPREAIAQVVGRLVVPVAVYALLLEGLAAVLPLTSLLHLAIVLVVAGGGFVATYAAIAANRYERDAYRGAARMAIRVAVTPLQSGGKRRAP
jgi:O-antigen/teichoic acid export membrane protein